MERESFKLAPSFFLKLSFFCVFAADFCCPPRSSGLAPHKGHEKRWHLGMARLLQGDMGHGAVGGGRPKLMSAWDTWCSGTWGVGWVGSSASLSGAGRCPKQGVRKEVARQSQPGMHHASTWLSAFVSLPHLQARPRLLVVCAHMCRCLWHVKSLLWQPPYSNFHKI